MWRVSKFRVSVVAVVAVAALHLSVRADDDDIDALQEKAVKAAVKRIAPCVVSIETSGGTDIIIAGPRGAQVRKGVGPTSGLIVSADGYVVTSAFNFANKPSSIIVSVPGHKEKFVAKKIATDQTRMLTLLKIDVKNLPLPTASPKKDIKIGHTALAVGRTLAASLEQDPSVSTGIISALDRIWGKALQTDAKVSPTNYGGPLLDLEGRVMGVLVPASPRGEGETAGLEWYDSGIGFAIPLEDVNRVLPELKKGKDLKKGMLGVAMRGRDQYADAPIIGTVSPGSAAAKAKLQVGDLIKAIDGKEVLNYAQVQHRLGNKYEGDKVDLVLERNKKDVKLTGVVLGGAAATFATPFLGILPMRDDPEPGVELRYVYEKSAAATAGLKAGDRITKIGPSEAGLRAFSGAPALQTVLAALPPGAELWLEYLPKGAKDGKKVKVTLGELPDSVPAELPKEGSLKKARVPKKPVGGPGQPPKKDDKKDPKKDDKKDDKKEDKEEKKPETGLLKRMNAAQDHHYWIYVPEDYDPDVSYSLVVWLHPVGRNKDRDVDALTSAWEDFCSENRIILVGPKSENESGWNPNEVDFIKEAVTSVMNSYTIDRRRVVAHGMGVGGQLAYYLGFAQRDSIRGVATIGAAMTGNPKERISTQPLSFFIVAGEKDPIREAVKDGRSKLADHKYPVVFHEMKEKGHQYFDEDSENVLKELVRWIDSLDRM